MNSKILKTFPKEISSIIETIFKDNHIDAFSNIDEADKKSFIIHLLNLIKKLLIGNY